MRFKSIASGSNGNCYYVEHEGAAFLIDLGINKSQLARKCSDHGVPLHFLQAILITHSHSDHVRGISAFCRKNPLPLYALPETYQGIIANPTIHHKPDPALCRNITCGVPFEVAGMKVTAFHVPHDSRDNVGYFIEAGGTNLCLMTDVGEFTPEMKTYIAKADNLVVESNYDQHMLETGSYHFLLKRRILSGVGHSSNATTASVLEQHLTLRTRRVFLCHLSGNNNTPELAYESTHQALRRAGLSPEIVVFSRLQPSLFFEL